MRFETSQHMKLGQHMKLAPRMIQSMEILQMPLAELEERIERELESNVTLERVEGNADEAPPRDDAESRDDADSRPMEIDQKAGASEFERLDRYEEQHPDAAENEFESSDSPSERPPSLREFEYSPSTPRAAGDRDDKLDAMAATPARAGSLADQLRDQWALAEVDLALRPLGELLIAFLDDDGYLRTPFETIIDRAPVAADRHAPLPEAGDRSLPVLAKKPTPPELERALKAVQLFLEPPGVGARDPRECLLLQLDAIAEESEDLGWPTATLAHARTLIEHHLDDLLQNRLPRVADKTGLSLDEIKEALTLMRRLSLAPARRLVERASAPIIPDAIVEFDPDHDRYIAYLNEARIPNLRVNQEYAKLAKDRQTPTKDRDFLKTNLSNAQWLIDAVQQRKQTLLRVVRAVVDAQRDAFDFGFQALKPLPMTLIADQLGIHVATVSRAVADKHLATPRGIVPLRKFFSGGLQTTSSDDAPGGEQLAWDAIKEALREIIDAEDKANPLSDEALVLELKKRGIDIARRTVAKYRDQLQIPTARLRKKF